MANLLLCSAEIFCAWSKLLRVPIKHTELNQNSDIFIVKEEQNKSGSGNIRNIFMVF